MIRVKDDTDSIAVEFELSQIAMLAIIVGAWLFAGYPTHLGHSGDVLIGLALGACLIVIVQVIGMAIGERNCRAVESAQDAALGLSGETTRFRAVTTVLGAVLEEILFRGILQPLATAHIGAVAAIALTNIVFGLLHGGKEWRLSLFAGAVGVGLGAAYALTDSLVVVIVAHVTNNLFMELSSAPARRGRHE